MAETATRELPRLVGYREIQDKFGLTRRQLERMQRDGRFPLAIRLTGDQGNKRAWPIEQVLAWFDEQRAGLVKLAVTNPSAIRDENLPDALQALAGRFIALHGEQVAPGDVLSVGIQRQLTDEQRAAIAAQAEETSSTFCETFGRLDTIRALLVVGGLMPVLRPLVNSALAKKTGVKPSQTAEELRDLAVDILCQSKEGEFVGPDVPAAAGE